MGTKIVVKKPRIEVVDSLLGFAILFYFCEFWINKFEQGPL